MTVTADRMAAIRAFAVDDDMCAGHCLAVKDLLDEVGQLRARITHLLEVEQTAQAAQRAEDDAAWQRHVAAMARLAR